MALDTRDLLAKTIMAEAGNQSPEGMLAVAAVIANRANVGGYGKGLDGVIMRPGQFSAWNSVTGYAGGEQGQNMNAIRPSEAAYAAADAVLSGQYNDPTGGATHYYNPSVSTPKWGQRAGGDWDRIGDHIFGNADAGRTREAVRASFGSGGVSAPQPQQPQAHQTHAGTLHTGSAEAPSYNALSIAAGPLHTGQADGRYDGAVNALSAIPEPMQNLMMYNALTSLFDQRQKEPMYMLQGY